MTDISHDKLQAYRDTDYRIEAPAGVIVMRIGDPCPPMAAALGKAGCKAAAFITAYNPRGQARPNAENEAAHVALKAEVEQFGCQYWEGSGADPRGEWPAEKSILALGLPREAAVEIGKRWGQDAIVWIEQGSSPELMLLR